MMFIESLPKATKLDSLITQRDLLSDKYHRMCDDYDYTKHSHDTYDPHKYITYLEGLIEDIKHEKGQK